MVDVAPAPRDAVDARPRDEREAAYTVQQTSFALRGGLVGVVVAIGLAVALTPSELLPDGQGALSSISHYYYTPARIIFAGALCAAALALLALTGTGVQSRILDLAALLAPLIALIPTPVRLAQIATFDPKCGRPDDACIPPDEFGDVRLGFQVWVWLAGIVIAVGLARAVRQAMLARRHPESFARVPALSWGTIAVALAIWAALVVTGYLVQPWFHATAHFLIAGTFFVLVSLVAWIEAIRQWRPRSTLMGDPEDRAHGSRGYAIAYAVVAVVLLADIVAAAVVIGIQKWGDAAFAPTGVFLVEAVGLGLFAVFFALQAWEHRRDGNGLEPLPPSRARLRELERREPERRGLERRGDDPGGRGPGGHGPEGVDAESVR